MPYSEPPHVVYGVDTNYIIPALVSIYSIWRHTKGAVKVSVFGHQLQEHDKETIQHAAFKCGHEISLEEYCPEELEEIEFGSYPISSLLPLSLPYLCDGRCIFVDADTLVLGDVNELNSFELGNMPIGACLDEVVFYVERRLFKLRLTDLVRPARNRRIKEKIVKWMVDREIHPGKGYFNSGVILMNCSEIQSRWPGGSLVDLRKLEKVKNEFPDQDYLNSVFRDQWCKIPMAWNCQPDLRQGIVYWPISRANELWFKKNDDQMIARRSPMIWHYYSVEKPWRATKKFQKCKAYSDWNKIAAEFADRTGISVQTVQNS